MDTKKDYQFHETAIIDEGAIVGKNTKIWHWSHICKGAVIGFNCSIGQNVFISAKASLGNNVKVQNNVSIYDDVIIEDDVFCGPSMVFTNVLNPRSKVSRKDEYKKTLIKRGATLGANSTIVCGVVIGEYAFIGAGAVVTKEVKPYALMLGVPAVQKGWFSAYGERIILKNDYDEEWFCSKTGDIYKLKNGLMTRNIGKYWTK